MVTEFFKMDKSRFFALLLSIIIFIFICLIYTQTNILDGIENASTDFKFFFRAPDQVFKKIKEGTIFKKNPMARDDLIIIGVDENTLRTFNDMKINNKNQTWPFDRNMHAKVTRYISSGNPLAIFFDTMFLDHTKYDKELAEAIKKSQCVFLDYPFEPTEYDKKVSDIDERFKILNQVRINSDPDDKYAEWVKEALPPVPILAKDARGIGFANVSPDPDHINRKMPLIVKFNGYYYPSIDLLLVMHYYGITLNDIEIKVGNFIKLKNIPSEKMAKPNPEREIKIPVDERGFMDLNFVGGHGSYNYFPYYYFYQDGVFNNPSLKNKILMIAAFSSTGIATDMHKSPYGDMFGIEHHANALNTILNQNFLVKLNVWQNILILLVIALILGFFLPRLSIVMSIVITISLFLIYLVGSQVLFETKDVIFIYTIAILQIGITFAFVIAYRVVTEQKEKKYIRQTFSKLVAKSVVDELLKDPEKLKLGGEKKLITVLFSDIRGFTSLTEKMQSETLVMHLNEYLEAMTNIVIKYEGTLDKYIGDAIMAFWGAPIPQENHALLACKAAVEMMQVLNSLNETWRNLKSDSKPPLNIGIGLNTGDMHVALMGSSSRMDYTLIGDNVNLGSRIEGINKEYRTNIIISEFTYQYVKDNVLVRELDLVRVKGKQYPVKLYELIDMK
jgi:adenylate cyclase